MLCYFFLRILLVPIFLFFFTTFVRPWEPQSRSQLFQSREPQSATRFVQSRSQPFQQKGCDPPCARRVADLGPSQAQAQARAESKPSPGLSCALSRPWTQCVSRPRSYLYWVRYVFSLSDLAKSGTPLMTGVFISSRGFDLFTPFWYALTFV